MNTMITVRFSVDELEQILDALGAMDLMADDIRPDVLENAENKLVKALTEDSQGLDANIVHLSFPEDTL